MNGNLLFLDALRRLVVAPWFACPFHQGLDGKKSAPWGGSFDQQKGCFVVSKFEVHMSFVL